MEQLCPECLGVLETRDGRTARCTVHGGEFTILFTRNPFPAPVAARNTAFALTEGALCAGHPTVSAAYACADCGKPICGTCSFAQPEGAQLCPDCAMRRTVSGSPVAVAQPQMAVGVRCVQHPNLPATAQCKICGGYVCNTCKFDLPGGIIMCPACATNPRIKLGSRQKKTLIGSYIAAVWCMLVMGALLGGVFQSLARDKDGQQALGLVLMVILVAPAIAGVGLGVGSKSHRAPSPVSVWIAIIWNSLILGGFMLLIVIGLLSKMR